MTVRGMVLAFITGSALSMTPGPASPLLDQQRVFRSTVEVVRLDVAVLDRERRPVRGLRSEAFSVMVDGVEQPLIDVLEVDYAETRSDDTLSDELALAGFISNRAPETRRAFVVILDDALTPGVPFMTEYAKNAARAFLEGLGPNDLVAVVYTWNGEHSQDFTTNRRELLDAVDQFRSGPGPRFPLTVTASSRTLRETVKRLHEVPHLRSAVVLISPGLTGGDPLSGETSIDAGSGIRTVSESDVILGSELRSAIGQAAYGRVPIYAISNRGLTAPGAGSNPLAGVRAAIAGNDFLRSVSENSGGIAVVNTNDFQPGVAQILRENSSGYVIGYKPTYPVDDGRYRRLEIRVRRSDASVFPSGKYFRTPSPSSEEVAPSTRLAIAGILPSNDVPLAVRTHVAAQRLERGEAEIQVEVAIGPVQDSQGLADLECVAYHAGRLREMAAVSSRIQLPNEPAAFKTAVRFSIAPGRYSLRCGLHALELGKLGSVYTSLTVPKGK